MTSLDWDREVLGPILTHMPRRGLATTAFHEAGHAVVARALGIAVEVVSIRPSDAHLGVAIHGPVGGSRDFDLGPWWEHPGTVTAVGRTVAICLAGMAAEALVAASIGPATWDENLGARAVDALSRLSRGDQTSLAASDADMAPVDDGTVAWRLAEAVTGSVEEGTAFLTLMRASARRLVNDHAGEIAALARALLQSPILDAFAVDRIIAKENL